MTDLIELIQPPAEYPEVQYGSWFSVPADDPLIQYCASTLWDRVEVPQEWESARLSGAAYLYRETKTDWTVVAKFYVVKTGGKAATYSAREHMLTEQAQSLSHGLKELRAVRSHGVWRGVLLLEYVDGLTLEDVIAVRHSRPGILIPSLEQVASFLAQLHTNGARPDLKPDFQPEIDHIRKIINTLVNHGVLQGYPVVRDGLDRLIDRWQTQTAMLEYTPIFSHGDATTSNFIFPWSGGMVAIDWERAGPADPAADLGRLLAEISHSINQHGGNVAEAQPFLDVVTSAYRQQLTDDWDIEAFLERTRFHRALSTLRIARNGWISRLDRTALVAQAMALLI